MKYHLTYVRIVISKRLETTSVAKDVEKKKLKRNVNLCCIHEKLYGNAFKKKGNLYYDGAVSLLGI